ncbi:hypothetical protein T492DRAFT_854294 [Pavlovales sp. CCMP2436]|nr:hypothetical protein T492DRAFT_854294 [Pavlovales sp. CCMP2436]
MRPPSQRGAACLLLAAQLSGARAFAVMTSEPARDLGADWRWTSPADVASDEGLGGGLFYAIEETFCDALLTTFMDDLLPDARLLVTCARLKGAIASAFSTVAGQRDVAAARGCIEPDIVLRTLPSVAATWDDVGGISVAVTILTIGDGGVHFTDGTWSEHGRRIADAVIDFNINACCVEVARKGGCASSAVHYEPTDEPQTAGATMQAFAKRGQGCLWQDDLDGLNALYLLCSSVVRQEPRCLKLEPNTGWLRVMIILIVPLAVILIFSLAVSLLIARRRRAQAGSWPPSVGAGFISKHEKRPSTDTFSGSSSSLSVSFSSSPHYSGIGNPGVRRWWSDTGRPISLSNGTGDVAKRDGVERRWR